MAAIKIRMSVRANENEAFALQEISCHRPPDPYKKVQDSSQAPL